MMMSLGQGTSSFLLFSRSSSSDHLRIPPVAPIIIVTRDTSNPLCAKWVIDFESLQCRFSTMHSSYHHSSSSAVAGGVSLAKGRNRNYSTIKGTTCDKRRTFPDVQTLRTFPKDELRAKVVLVRFDSLVLLCNDLHSDHAAFSTTALFTIKYLYEAGATVILVSDWTKGNTKLLRAEEVADYLSSALQIKVVPANSISMHMQFKNEGQGNGDILLLDDLSNSKEEMANDLDFAERLSFGVDIFVNDSFSLAHKIRASTVGITRFCHSCVAGFHFEERMQHLKKVSGCRDPCVAIIGGVNFLKKAAALNFLADTCDHLAFVGFMAFDIMHALGMPVPSDLLEGGALEEATKVVQYAKRRGTSILLPRDFLCTNNLFPDQLEIFSTSDIPRGWEPVDLGPMSLDEIASLISNCEKVIWIGAVKFRPSNRDTSGTLKLASILDDSTLERTAVTVVGNEACEAVRMTSKSSSDYQMIEAASIVWDFLIGRDLPGIMALDRGYSFELNWNTIYSDSARPLVVDVGSGNGLFLDKMAALREDVNYLGLEMNKKLVSRCLQSAARSQHKNIYYISTDATSTFRTIVSSYPGPLVLVTIQCPNPDFNRPEYRWRMVQSKLVEAIVVMLASGGKVFLQSDVEYVAMRMREQFLIDGEGKLAVAQGDGSNYTLGNNGWLEENPFGVQSDWEQHVLARGAPMYRLMLSKVANC